METYIHPSDEKIKEFIQKLELVNKDLKDEQATKVTE